MATYTIFILVARIYPKKYIDKHTINVNKVATIDLSFRQKVTVLGLSITTSCGLFLLGNYGVAGDFYNDTEELLFGAVMLAGISTLAVTGVWEVLVIRAEIKRDEEDAGAESSGEGVSGEREGEETLVNQLSSVWVGLGVVATSGESVQVTKRRA